MIRNQKKFEEEMESCGMSPALNFHYFLKDEYLDKYLDEHNKNKSLQWKEGFKASVKLYQEFINKMFYGDAIDYMNKIAPNKKMAANQQFFMPNAAYLVLNILATLDNWMIEYIIKELSSKDFVKLDSKEREDFSSKIARYINEDLSESEQVPHNKLQQMDPYYAFSVIKDILLQLPGEQANDVIKQMRGINFEEPDKEDLYAALFEARQNLAIWGYEELDKMLFPEK